MRVFDRRTAGQKSVGLYPEGSLTVQIDQIVLRFSSVREQLLSWHPKFTLHYTLVTQPFTESTSKSSPKHSPLKAIKVSSHRCSLNINSFQIPSFRLLLHTPNSALAINLTLFTSQRFTLTKAYLSQKDERPLLGNLQNSKHFRPKWEERESQQDATIRCLLSTSVSTCFGHHYAHLQENKDRVVGCEQCSHPTTQRPTTATNHIQQNQNNTPNAVTRSLFSWRWA